MVYSISSFSLTTSYTPPKSKLKLPSLAAMVVEKLPPSRRSLVAAGACQSSEAAHHLVICSGLLHASQTFATGALTIVSTVINFFVAVSINVCFIVIILIMQTYGQLVKPLRFIHDIERAICDKTISPPINCQTGKKASR